jgi:predicted TIM-barrel fold metal-dependent hydrolase
MGRIAQRGGSVRVHGYAPFDPLREALFRDRQSPVESPFALVKRAVHEEGFIGVKLYPPMGFLPFDNTKKLFAGDYPHFIGLAFRKKMNAALDAVLRDLYAWCISEQVPILAHAANTNGADQGYSLRASPDNWVSVVKNFPGIRVSLAHFGDFDAGFATATHPHPKLDETWEWKMAKLVHDNPDSQIYVDMSYLRVALLDSNNNVRSEVKRMLRDVKKEFPDLSKRMLFGTDWVMFGKEELFDPLNRNGKYADRVGELLSDLGYGDSEINGIMYINSGDFLGFRLPASVAGNKSRLKEFYQAHQLPDDWLNEFQIHT